MKIDVTVLNKEMVFVTQACLGAISLNIVSIQLIPSEQELTLRFDLEKDDELDREEIQNIVEDFYAMHDDDPNVRVEIVIVGKEFARLPPPARAIYIRK